MVTKPRAEGDARDFQLFTIEKLTNIPLAMSSPPQFLKKSYDKARVVINTASGMRCLDLGAGECPLVFLAYIEADHICPRRQ